ncbi:hypothetical protein DFP83_10882 [Idiomarina fontislapidosi]|uniref:DUF1249 domain-containing protein n=1 Tax=Idiomarina fontislapidosi TaxID=263723 RepID=A0A432XV73_9GAMM|nr:DUF1249 domain-containing protein [Idiomarina fontislapidosi]PYE31821.1 hypothetical protein DFP83_10882 [Idiomarina fontislapidosi]RUO52504.1 DUF1249 domain-containing protein [Idiomarina fontislapidosi]
MRNERYVVDVAELHRINERNYAGLIGLLPDHNQLRLIRAGAHLVFEITWLNESKYTSDVRIAQKREHWSADYLLTQLDVRLYHDVRMAEVLASQGVSRLRVHYQQPNPDMRHPDEKHQVNQFLADWLTLIRTHGQQPMLRLDKFLPHDFK